MEKVQLPEGWRLITGEFPFELGAGKRDVRLVSFAVPITALAGRYQLIYAVKDRRNYGIRDEDRIEIVVLPVARLEIIRGEIPERVIAGEEYQANFLVTNGSNARTRIVVDIKSSEGYPATANIAPDSEFFLTPGASQRITVTVRTDKGIRQKATHRLMVRVKALDLNQGDVTAAITALVQVIPRVTSTIDPYHRISGWLKIASMSEEGQIGTQGEFSGSGYLDEAKTQRIDVLLRWPDTTEKGIFGLRDEYRLSLRGKRGEIHIGDRSYSLSPLTEQFRYGRGVEGALNLKNWRIGGYFLQTRREQPAEQEMAGFLGYRFGQSLRLGLNYLNKNNGTLGDDDIGSIEALARPMESMDLELEYAIGRRRQSGNDVTADAWRAQLKGDIGRKVNYHLEKLHADSDYPGYYHNVDMTSGTVTLPLWKGLRLRASYIQWQNNLKKDPMLSAALNERIYRTGLDYRFWRGTRLSLGYENLRRQDTISPADFDFEEKAIKLGAGHSFKTLSLLASVWLGRLDDKLTDEMDNLERYRIYANYDPTPRQHYSGYFEAGHQTFLQKDVERTKTAGLSASYKLTHSLLFTIDLQKNGFDGETGENDQWIGGLNYTLPNRQLISLRARHLDFKESHAEDRTSVMISYSIPIGIPVSRKKSIGILRGRVYEAEDPQLRGIPNVVVNVNAATAVTDKKGEFLFPSLKTGPYHLWVDRGALGLNRVTTIKTPIEMTVEGGKDKRIELGVTRSTILRGKAVVFRPVDNRNIIIDGRGEGEKEIVEAYGFANLWLDLKNGKETLRRRTDQKGSFSFEGLRPGKWHLKIYDHNLPLLHYLEQGTFDLDLKPGGEEDVLIRILPRLRPLHMIEEGVISLR